MFGAGVVKATPTNAILTDGVAAIEGGIVVIRETPDTPERWCAYYGVRVEDGVAILYKGLDDNFRSPRGMDYTPGLVPAAPDWDADASRECGGGLHGSPTPRHTHEFVSDAKRYVACPVRIEDILVHTKPIYPAKVRFRACCAPTFEVDVFGDPVPVKAEARA